MPRLRCRTAISLDGCTAGPNQSEENPIGEGGMRLHEWMFELAAWRRAQGREGGEVNASTAVVEEANAGIGAVLMGRNMFGPVRGPWGENLWQGWWGEEPPFHAPVFVLTHHQRPQLTLGETTFHFVTDGLERAVELAREAAGEEDVSVAGGAATIRQCIAAGLLDELTLHLVPVLLGGGECPLEGLSPTTRFEQLRAVEAPGVTHLTYRLSS
jgi:dihydrofolate reductase